MENSKSASLNVMLEAVSKVGGMIRRDFGEVENLQIASKGLNDFVTSTDFKVQKKLVEILREKREKYGIIAEEENLKINGADIAHNFIVDPIDGTTNFMHGFPYFAVSIGLTEQKNFIAGVVYNPITEEVFYAEKGQGAYLDHPYKSKRLRVSKRRELGKCLISFYPALCAEKGDCSVSIRDDLQSKYSVRDFGSIALDMAYLASGKLDAMIAYKPKLVDYAGGIPLVVEAGGFVEEAGDFLIAGCSREVLDELKDICLKK